MKEYQVIGIMSGSSLDGIDLAYCIFHIDPFDEKIIPHWKFIAGKTYPYSIDFKLKLKDLRNGSAMDLAMMNARFGEFSGEKVLEFLKDNPPLHPDMISSHGHTVFHYPSQSMTFQIGSGASLAAITGIPAVCDFRQGDVALGGQGAPLSILADQRLFPGHTYYLNLGGIANISLVQEDHLVAYDLFGFNQMINGLSKQAGFEMDEDGHLGKEGQVVPDIINSLKEHPYLDKSSRKSLDNDYVQKSMVNPLLNHDANPKDKIRSFYEFISWLITDELKRLSSVLTPNELFFSLMPSGGGAKNKFFMTILSDQCRKAGVQISEIDEDIIDFKEAILIAYMGVLRWLNRPNCIAQSTGAHRSVSGGGIYLP